MPREQPEQGERKTHHARYRGSIGPCKGWDDSHDPSTLPDENLVEAINIRVHDGITVSRPGQEKINTDPMTGSVYGLIEIDGGAHLFLSPFRDSDSFGMLDVFIDGLDDANRYIRLTNDNGELGTFAVTNGPVDTSRFCFCHWNGMTVFAGVGGQIYEIVVPSDTLDPTKIKLRNLFELPDSAGEVSSFCVIPSSPSVLYIGTDGGGVYSFDGQALLELAAPATYTDRVIVFTGFGNLYAAGTQAIDRWDGTVWVPIVLPAGTPPTGVSAFIPTCAVEYNSVIYIGGFESIYGFILLLDSGDNCTVSGLLPTDTEIITDLCVHKGKLLMGWAGIVSVTYRAFVWVYNSATSYVVDIEGNGIVSRMLSLGEELYVGSNGNQYPVGLLRFTGPDVDTLTVESVADTAALFSDIVGAGDIIAF